MDSGYALMASNLSGNTIMPRDESDWHKCLTTLGTVFFLSVVKINQATCNRWRTARTWSMWLLTEREYTLVKGLVIRKYWIWIEEKFGIDLAIVDNHTKVSLPIGDQKGELAYWEVPGRTTLCSSSSFTICLNFCKLGANRDTVATEPQ